MDIYIKLSTNTADKIYLFKIRNSLFHHKNGSSGDYPIKIESCSDLEIIEHC